MRTIQSQVGTVILSLKAWRLYGEPTVLQPAGGDFHLRRGSPAVDVALNVVAPPGKRWGFPVRLVVGRR